MNNPAMSAYVAQLAGQNNQQYNPAYGVPTGAAFDPSYMQALQRQALAAQQSSPLHQQYPQQVSAGARPQSRSSHTPQAQGQPSNGSNLGLLKQNTPQFQFPPGLPPTSAPTTSDPLANMAIPGQTGPLVQPGQPHNAAQAAKSMAQVQQVLAAPPTSASSAARERARVTVLLEINTQLLQEVVSLQSQGKAGTTPGAGQQSPTSPTATDATALTSSPGGGNAQAKPASQEYGECMRRLQANLSYLAAIADAKKKASGALPTVPAVMTQPPHMPQMAELYKKLTALFPEAGQATMAKAVSAAQSQNAANKGPQVANNAVMAHG